VTLLVADGTRSTLSAVLDDAETVAVDGLADALSPGDDRVVVVDCATVDARSAAGTVRAHAPDAVVVSVGGDVGDVVAATADEQAVSTAVARARDVAAYRASVADLYEACRGRALGRPDEDLRETRAQADRRLAELPSDRQTVAAALRTGDRGDDGGHDDAPSDAGGGDRDGETDG
jgi:phage terminase large subunit-like protein